MTIRKNGLCRLLGVICMAAVLMSSVACNGDAGGATTSATDVTTAVSDFSRTTITSAFHEEETVLTGDMTGTETDVSASSLTTQSQTNATTQATKASSATTAVSGNSQINIDIGYNYNEKAADGTYVKGGESGWILDWSDEFNGTWLNTALWQKNKSNTPLPLQNTEDSSITYPHEYSFDTIFLDGKGRLILQNKIENGVYYSSELQARSKNDRTYGYYECRCILTKSEAVNSAIWLMPRNTSNFKEGPENGAEIDIMEAPCWLRDGTEGVTPVNGTYMGGVTQNVHWGGYGETYQSANGHVYYPQPGIPAGYYDKMHVYGLKWTPDMLYFYVDGVEVWKYDCRGEGVPQVPHYLILSSVYSMWAGAPQKAEADAQFVVDYVRVFKRDSYN